MASSRSESSGSSEPVRLSFGVELEFLVAYIPEDRGVKDDDDENLAKAIPMPGPEDIALTEKWHCQERIEDALEELGVLGNGDDNRVFRDLAEGRWGVSDDPSLILPNDLDIDTDTYLGAKWIPIEIQSPAFWDEPESWEEVRNVCQHLTEKFWIITPFCTGLHFHVGTGSEWMSLRNLRRTAALLFAADPILVEMHPTHRKDRRFCLSNRVFSAVAQGTTASTAKTALDKSVQRKAVETNEEQEVIDRQRERSRSPHSANPVLEVPPPPDTDFDRKITRGQLTSYPYTFSQRVAYPTINETRTAQAPADMDQCIKELTKASSRGVIEMLMQDGQRSEGRLAYNFKNFRETLHEANQESRKRTIEFRQSAGSLEAEEVLAFGKAYVQLCRFATRSTYGQFWGVVKRCIGADTARIAGQQVTDFDVFDLLLLMGLENEATDLQNVILAQPPLPDDDGSLLVFSLGQPLIEI